MTKSKKISNLSGTSNRKNVFEIKMEVFMKFILISRHTGGREIPESEKYQNLKDMTDWMRLLKAEIAMPIRGGKSVTAKKVEEYDGDAGGIIIFQAENFDKAIELAKKSPGLKYGFTHEVFPEISMEAAADK